MVEDNNFNNLNCVFLEEILKSMGEKGEIK